VRMGVSGNAIPVPEVEPEAPEANSINAGCCLGHLLINHLLYADDVVLVAPSAKGLQRLLDTCTCFAASHDVVFNTCKSQVLVVPGRNMPTVKPCFRLCNSAMDFTDQYKYLGHIIADDLRDDADISRQTRLLYARANMLLRKFSAAHITTKIVLFNAFCSPVYGYQLWFNFIKEPFRRIHVAFNNALRLLLKMPTWCMLVSCLSNMALLLFWLLFANSSSRYYARCAHVIMISLRLLLAVIVSGALLY